jgi:hypothetical protein
VKKNTSETTPCLIASVEETQDGRPVKDPKELLMSLDEHSNYYNPGMDPCDSFGNDAGLLDSEVEMRMHEDANTSRQLSPNPDIYRTQDPTTSRSEPLGSVDKAGNILTLHSEPGRCSHVALPE